MTRDLQKEFDEIIKRTVVPFFKGQGFKKSGNGFNKNVNDIIQVVSIQKSQWNHSDNVSFTFNIGFFNIDIFNESWDKMAPKFIREYDTQIQFRLGHLTKQSDYWYELKEKVSTDELENELMDHLNNYLRPIFDKHQTLFSLKALMTSNEKIKSAMGTADKILLLLKTNDREKAELMLRTEYQDSLTPKELTSTTVYPDGRREEKKSTPKINTIYVDRLKRIAASNKIGL